MDVQPVSESKSDLLSSTLSSERKMPPKKDDSSSISWNSARLQSKCFAFIESIFNHLSDAFKSLLTWFGFKVTKDLDWYIRHPRKFLELLAPSVLITNPEEITMQNSEYKSVFHLLCIREGEELTLEDGSKLSITPEVIQKVILAGADHEIARSPKFFLSIAKSPEVIQKIYEKTDKKTLIEKGKYESNTILHSAASEGKARIVEWVLNIESSRSFMWEKNDDGYSALHCAANIETAKVILRFDFETTIVPDRFGRLPFDRAIGEKHHDVGLFLIKEMIKEKQILQILLQSVIDNFTKSASLNNFVLLYDRELVAETVFKNLPPAGTELGDLARTMLLQVSYIPERLQSILTKYNVVFPNRN